MKKEYEGIITISKAEAAMIETYLNLVPGVNDPDEFQSEDYTISNGYKFPDGVMMDVKCCGSQTEASWTEAVLFKPNGVEICCSEPCDEYLGEWELSYGENTYKVKVVVQ